MSWAAYVLFIELTAANWCEKLPVEFYGKSCTEEVVECVLDGEKMDFCKNLYIEERFLEKMDQ